MNISVPEPTQYLSSSGGLHCQEQVGSMSFQAIIAILSSVFPQTDLAVRRDVLSTAGLLGHVETLRLCLQKQLAEGGRVSPFLMVTYFATVIRYIRI